MERFDSFQRNIQSLIAIEFEELVFSLMGKRKSGYYRWRLFQKIPIPGNTLKCSETDKALG